MVMNPMVESVKASPKKQIKGYDGILNSLYGDGYAPIIGNPYPQDPCMDLATWMVDFYGKYVGKYTNSMDPMGNNGIYKSLILI